jgi:phosphoribosylformimino-5-aminoimidazole carboxamide ribotide isomerase
VILFPAIDLRDGHAVRLVQGDFESVTVFNDDPVAQARQFADQGATHLHVVDLDGALEGVPVHAPVVATIAAVFGGTVHFGGGMRSRAAIETAIATGIDRVVVGTAVLQDASLLRWAIDRLGDRLVVALDARDGKLATHAWTVTSDHDALTVAADLVTTGVRHLLYTDISRDGMLDGPNLPALRRLAAAAPPLGIIASGGISSLDDLRQLANLGLDNLTGVVVGRALYEQRFTVTEALAVLDRAPPKTVAPRGDS